MEGYLELESGSYQFEVKNEILNGLYSMIAFGIIIFESSINDFVLLINFLFARWKMFYS